MNQISFDLLNTRIVIQGTSDADQVSVSQDVAGTIRVHAQSVDGIVEATFQRSAVTSILFGGGDGNDRFENDTTLPSRASGDGGNDVLIGGGGADDLQGDAGDDQLFGGGGNDLMSGGDGNDSLRDNDGDDRLSGDGGNDDLQGGSGNDSLFGGLGNDVLWGGDGNDELRGNDGDDRLLGEGGDDDLQGHNGNDELFGGLGNDELWGGAGVDQLRGNEGNDRLLGEDGNDDLMGHDGSDEVIGGLGDDRILGGEGNDQLRGNEGNDRLLGEGGDDDLQGGDGKDELIGGLGRDVLWGGAGADELRGNEGDDRLLGEDGNDDLMGHDGSDEIFGGLGDDRILGGEGNDQLRGNEGNDRLLGEGGDDDLQGGDGNDELIGGLGNDLLAGGTGSDELRGNEGNDNLSGDEDNDDIQGNDGNDELMGGLGDDRLFGGEGVDRLRGNEGNDRLVGEGGNDDLDGMLGDDELFGGLGNDSLTGDLGNDKLRGDAGDDRLAGGDGNDDLRGGDGNDELFGGLGADTLRGELGNDTLRGNDGDDRLFGEDGVDDVQGGAGNDEVYGGRGNDYVTGDDGSDRLYGEDGDDQLLGLDGNDYLFGGSGADQLSGGSAADLLVGGDGDDTLAGEYGNDVLIGGKGKDLLSGQGDEDILIGGTTAYDDDLIAQVALLSAWASPALYADRVAQIEDELFASWLESNETVFDDAAVDTLFGHEGQDWFFLTGFMGVYDPNLVDGHASGDAHEMAAGAAGHAHSGPVILDEPPALEGFALIDSLDLLSDRQSSEALHTLIPHADSSVLQREHLSLTELVKYADVTHYAVSSGNWSNPATWHNGVVPSSGARVLIPIGVEVAVDRVVTTRLATVRVDGKLSFATAVNTELRVDTVVVTSTGIFEMGSATTPVGANVTARLMFTDNGPIDRVADPFGIGRGLISHGSVSMHGAAVTTHLSVIGSVAAGTNSLTLSSVPTGWKVGQSIVLAATTPGTEQNEVRRISAIVGNRVFVDQVFTYHHVPYSAQFSVDVANLTRNVVVESESTVIARRGHVMFMHNRDVHVENAAFNRLGRTDKSTPINDAVVDANWQLAPGTGTNVRGRYAIHFHRNGLTNDGNPSTISGSAVVDSPGWGFVNHSSYVDMSDNVAYGINGAGFATEAGDEIGSFDGNISIGSTASGDGINSRSNLQDFGHGGDGFWFQGTGVAVVNNIAAGNAGAGYQFYARGLIEGGEQRQFLAANLPDPSISGGAATIDVGSVPMYLFSDNVGYASAVGLAIRYHLRDSAHSLTGTMDDSQFWNNTRGVDLSYSWRVNLRNLTIVTVPGFAAQFGVATNTVTRDVIFENLTVVGYNRGITMPRIGYGIVLGGVFDNTEDDIAIHTALTSDRVVRLIDLAGTPHILLGLSFTESAGLGHMFVNDTVIADYGPFSNQRLYYDVQHPTAVPFPNPTPGIPPAYVGRTAQQLFNLYGIAIGGQLAPAGVVVVPSIEGLVGPAT